MGGDAEAIAALNESLSDPDEGVRLTAKASLDLAKK
jgi:hypothetical protein